MVRAENPSASVHPMLLACPNCATTYEVNDAVIGENGRSLRCARCQNVWFATRSQELVFASDPAKSQDPNEPAQAPANSPEPAAPEPPAPVSTQPDDSTPAVIAPPLAPAASDIAPSPSPATPTTAGEDIETFARRHARIRADRSRRLRNQFGPPAIIVFLALVITALVAWRTNIVRMAPQMASLYGAIGLPVNLRELIFGDVKISKEARDGVPVLLVEGAIVSMSKHPVEVPRLRFGLRNQAGQEIYSWSALPEHSVLAPGATLPFRSRLASPPSDGHDVVVRFFTRRDAIEGAR